MITPGWNPNYPTGTAGLIAVDKVGNKVLFLDRQSLAVTAAVEGFAPRVHELAISPDRGRAYVPIYGNGRHGANPVPGHAIAVIDLRTRRHVGDIDVAPNLAPHGNAHEVGSRNAHRIEVLPDGSKLYTENEEDGFASVLDLHTGRRLPDIAAPNALAGLGLSPDGKQLILVDASRLDLLVVDTASDRILRRIRLSGHRQAAQIVRYAPDGPSLVVTSHDEGLGTALSADFEAQRTMRLGKGPMDMAFHPDGRTVLVGNQGDGTISVLDLARAELRGTVEAGAGIEVLAFY
jgi:DNA-binding beta-propeller fold protein YncE